MYFLLVYLPTSTFLFEFYFDYNIYEIIFLGQINYLNADTVYNIGNNVFFVDSTYGT